MSCSFCYNAYVWGKESHTDEDYFDGGLNNTNDFSSCSIGLSDSTHQIYFNAGAGVPCNIEICKWGENAQWNTVARYYPKFCPECGRKLDEFIINERGTSFERGAN